MEEERHSYSDTEYGQVNNQSSLLVGEDVDVEVEEEVHVENLTCRQALRNAKRQCMNIKNLKDLYTYFHDRRQSTFFFLVTFSMVGLMLLGLIFYYEPRGVCYLPSSLCHGTNADGQAIATAEIPVLHGYDIVEYFSLGKWSHATKGNELISYKWDYNWTDPRDQVSYSYLFWFASEANKQKFIGNPWKYLPKYGGFSAYKTATEEFWNVYPDPKIRGAAPFCHPDAFIVQDGALYMEYSLEYKKLFIESKDVINKADAKWKKWYGSLQSGPLNNFAVRGRFARNEDHGSGKRTARLKKAV